jgi:hypothetical protein
MSITNIHRSPVGSEPINWHGGMNVKRGCWVKKVTKISAIKFLRLTELVRLSDKKEKEQVT